MTPRYADVFCIQCPLCDASIVLPRQSPLGKYEDQWYRPTGAWPITLLCIRSEQTCECSRVMIRRELLEKPGQDSEGMVLWEIACGCAHEDCKRQNDIYAWYRRGDHDVELKEEKIRAAVIEF
jgi:hypothetical protein